MLTPKVSRRGLYFCESRSPRPRESRCGYTSTLSPSDGSEGDNEGVCLSIIDTENRNGMILNGFALHLEAMQFGDTLWNDHFLGDTGIMERMITEKRVAWDQNAAGNNRGPLRPVHVNP